MLWTKTEIAQVRHARRVGMRTEHIARTFGGRHSRDEVIEAIDATMRFQDDREACGRANSVQLNQADGIPMINGRPTVETRGAHYSPMF